MESDYKLDKSSAEYSLKPHRIKTILLSVFLTTFIVSGLMLAVYFLFFEQKEENNQTTVSNTNSYEVADNSLEITTLESMPSEYAKLFTGVSKYLLADGSLNTDKIKENATWDDLKNLVVYSLYGFSRVKSTAFQAEGYLNLDEIYSLSISQIDTEKKVEINNIYTKDFKDSYIFSSSPYEVTPKSIQSLVDGLDKALGNGFGVPSCEDLKETEVCEFSKDKSVIVNKDELAPIEIKFERKATKALASSTLVSKVFADQTIGDYEVIAKLYGNGLLSELTFNIIGNEIRGNDAPWYVVSKFAYVPK